MSLSHSAIIGLSITISVIGSLVIFCIRSAARSSNQQQLPAQMQAVTVISPGTKPEIVQPAPSTPAYNNTPVNPYVAHAPVSNVTNPYIQPQQQQ
ncbi:hypothetical protein HDU76_000706 [Blyttiomyces sp. JEL0837]|nr:hypothetical protein HDU76_000706 [Blyttiomyces sp. JEL0837]